MKGKKNRVHRGRVTIDPAVEEERSRRSWSQLVPAMRTTGVDEISDEEYDRLAEELGIDNLSDLGYYRGESLWDWEDDIPEGAIVNPPLYEGNRFNPAVQNGPVPDRYKKTWLEVDHANEHDRLTPEVLVGAWPHDVAALQAEGVKLVVTGCGMEGTMPRWSEYGIDWYDNVTGDDGHSKPTSWFAGMFFAARPYLERGETVLFHCGAGINRGPSMAYFALRAFYGLSRDEATTILSTKRPICTPSTDHVRYGIAYRDDADKALKQLGLGR